MGSLNHTTVQRTPMPRKKGYNMQDIMVSIICTAYNHEKYIRKCLDGFVMQETDFLYEVLVHDDASTDTTSSIIQEYEKLYPNIIKPIYQTENQYSKGVSITRNIIFPKCRGKYIAICEGDDYWTDPNKLQKQIAALETHPDCFMCVCKAERVSEDESEIIGYCPSFPLDEGVIESDGFLDIVFKEYAFHTSSYVFCASLYKRYAENTPDFVRTCPVGDEAYMLYFGYAGNVYYCKDTMTCNRRGSIGGWNERTWSNRNNRKKYYLGMAETYKKFDVYTKGRYHEMCLRKIYLEQYFAAESARDFQKLFFAKEHMFLKQPVRRKIRIFTGAVCNPLLKLFYKVVQKK